MSQLHCLSSSEGSEEDFCELPDLATRLLARRVPAASTTLPGSHRHPARKAGSTSSADDFNMDCDTSSGSEGVHEPLTSRLSPLIRGDSQHSSARGTEFNRRSGSLSRETGTDGLSLMSSDEGDTADDEEHCEDVTVIAERSSLPARRVGGDDDLPDLQPLPERGVVERDHYKPSTVERDHYKPSTVERDHYKPSTVERDRYKPSTVVHGPPLPPPSQTLASPSPPLTKAEAKRRGVEERKRERQRLKREREQQKEREKNFKEMEKLARKANTPAECTKWLLVSASEQLCSSSSGSQLAAAVAQTELQWRQLRHPPLTEAVTFHRLDPSTRQETLEDHSIIVLDAEPFLKLVQNQLYPPAAGSSQPEAAVGYTLAGRTVRASSGGSSGGSSGCTLEEQCRSWQQLLAVNNLTLFIWGLEQHFKSEKGTKTANKRRRSRASSESRPQPNRLDVETALLLVQLRQRVNHRLFSDAQELAQYAVHLATAVAKAPHKRVQLEDGALFATWYAEGSNVCPVRVTAGGVGLKKLWLQQLRQFTSVGLETAQAIAAAYGSPSQLMEAYSCLSPADGAGLLAAIPVRRGAGPLQTTRRVGPELSKKVHTFLTSDCRDRVLGS